MASEGFHVQSVPSASATPAGPAPVVSEQRDQPPPQPVHSVLNTTQTDSEPVLLEKAKAGAHADRPEAPKQTVETRPPAEPASDRSLGGTVAASEPQAPVEAQKAESKSESDSHKVELPLGKEEPQIGEKRGLDATDSTAPALGVPAKLPSEKPDEHEAKKQKTDQETAGETNGTSTGAPATAAPPQATTSTDPAASAAPPAPEASSAPASDANGDLKKTGRSKKEKIKDAVKKAIPSDGIGSRTRSRTKGA
ncbi:hypothetical protein N7462_009618 [Penicillium macrosclerotiorum]|uniref:uncharacterized protein n=1 Tax=Penicillium macrosclerotiorum TaxID=303699 RepID=UPI0025496C31|nr:uncharacterized protein N7462_009618 [Penicillium macrosclerotiorum]KAJ5674179.1 hypothetical protein N7462_009618 [Penicillium macrosclerotiorum]